MSRRQPTVPLRALVIISFVALTVLLLASAGFASGGDVIPTEVAQPTVEYEVRPGDSLWSIASAHTPQDGDVRATVADLRHRNTLTGSLIHPGQILAVPTPPT